MLALGFEILQVMEVYGCMILDLEWINVRWQIWFRDPWFWVNFILGPICLESNTYHHDLLGEVFHDLFNFILGRRLVIMVSQIKVVHSSVNFISGTNIERHDFTGRGNLSTRYITSKHICRPGRFLLEQISQSDKFHSKINIDGLGKWNSQGNIQVK
jgi:hypothetical protein